LKPAVHDAYREHADSHWWMRARRAIFGRVLREWMTLPRRARILDVGPGSGVNLEVLRQHGSVAALDVNRESLLACRGRGADHLLLGDAAQPPLAPASFDLVCALDVLEHLADDREALASWRAVLRPGGRLLLTVPALRLLWGRQDVLSGHYRRYRRRELRARLRESGFAVERLTYFNTLLFLPILAVRLCMRPFLRRAGREGSRTDLGVPSFGLNDVLYRVFAAEGAWLAKRDLPIGVSLLCVAAPASSVSHGTPLRASR
jgi:SAM-dependent methyltransferase